MTGSAPVTFQYVLRAPDDDAKIVGTGIRVHTIQVAYAMGEPAEYIAEQRDLPVAAVFEALAYAEEHPEEMEAWERENDAVEQLAMSGMAEGWQNHLKETRERTDREFEGHVRQARESRLRLPL